MLKKSLQQSEQKPIDWPVPLTPAEKLMIERSLRLIINDERIFPNDVIKRAICIAKKLRLEPDFENELRNILE